MDRHPNIDICVSHGGGAATFLKNDGFNGFSKVTNLISFQPYVHYGMTLISSPSEAHDFVVSVVGKDRMVYGPLVDGIPRTK